MTAACQDPAIQRWTLVPSPYRREHAEEWLAGAAQRAQAGETVSLLAVGEEGRLAGSFSLMEIDLDRGYGEIGYWVARRGARPRGRHAGDAAAARVVHRASWACGGWRSSPTSTTRPPIGSPSAAATGPRASCARSRAARIREPVYAVYVWEA